MEIIPEYFISDKFKDRLENAGWALSFELIEQLFWRRFIKINLNHSSGIYGYFHMQCPSGIEEQDELLKTIEGDITFMINKMLSRRGD